MFSLSFQLPGFAITQVVDGETIVVVYASAQQATSSCLRCQYPSQSIHTATFRNLEPCYGMGERQISKGVPPPVVHAMEGSIFHPDSLPDLVHALNITLCAPTVTRFTLRLVTPQ
jgi:hypothetical protein